MRTSYLLSTSFRMRWGRLAQQLWMGKSFRRFNALLILLFLYWNLQRPLLLWMQKEENFGESINISCFWVYFDTQSPLSAVQKDGSLIQAEHFLIAWPAFFFSHCLCNSVSSSLLYVPSIHIACSELQVPLTGELHVWSGIQLIQAQLRWALKVEISSCGTMKCSIKPAS